MKILVDQNISFRVLPRISGQFPIAVHVKSCGLIDSDDWEIFKYARQNGFEAIMTQDDIS